MAECAAEMAALKEEVRVLRVVVRDLAYITRELIEVEPRVDQAYATALEDHLISIGEDE